jgi:SAM-dependent methyltransferase
MSFFSRSPPVRVPHDEPGFVQPDFVAEYGVQTAKTPAEFRPILRYLASQLDRAQTAEILEIGPGPGWMAIELAKSHPAVRITGIDTSEAFVALAIKNSRCEGVADRTAFTLGEAAEMHELADDSFDAVFSNQSLHYWDSPERVFNQIARVLKPSGVFCIGDDRRDMNWQGKLQVMVGRCILSRRIGASWERSLLGCLTPAEVGVVLERSELHDRWHITTRSRTMLITSKQHK